MLDRLVGWKGGAELWTLDLERLVWEKIDAAASNKVAPTAPCQNGTYGRFRYIPSRNAYVVVNSVKENVFLGRLSDRAAQPIPARFAAAMKGRDAAVVRWAAGQVALWPREKALPALKAALDAQRGSGPAEAVEALRRTLEACGSRENGNAKAMSGEAKKRG